MKEIDFLDLNKWMKSGRYYKIENFVSDEEIEQLKLERDQLLSQYNLDGVKERLFYLREDSKNRQGDAVMVSNSDTDLPSLKISGKTLEYFNLYNSIISNLTGKLTTKDTRCMYNSQQYFEESLPVWEHYDCEIFDYEHSAEDSAAKKDGYSLKILKGLIPRYVMVLVLDNQNQGVGTYIRYHSSDKRISLENNKGDLIIFDNLSVRHGVPELKNPRSMIGFRNFDHLPYYFESSPEGGNKWIELPDKNNPGWYMEYSNEEAKDEMKKFNKFWKETLFDKFKDKKAAF